MHYQKQHNSCCFQFNVDFILAGKFSNRIQNPVVIDFRLGSLHTKLAKEY